MLRREKRAENRLVFLTNFFLRFDKRFLFLSVIFYLISFGFYGLLVVFVLLLLRNRVEGYFLSFISPLFLLILLPFDNAPYVVLSLSLFLSFLFVFLVRSSVSIFSFIPSLLVAFLHFEIYYVFLSLFFSLLFFLFFVFVVESPFRFLKGVSFFSLLYAFLKAWYGGGKEEFERILSRISVDSKVLTESLLFDDGVERVELFIPYFHFGPFGTVGSGSFPSYADKNRIVVHGLSSHQTDFVFSREAEDIAKADFDYKINSNKGRFLKGSYGKAKAYCLDFDLFRVVFLSRYPYVTEDLTAGALFRLKLLKGMFVDMHNSSAENITFFDELSHEVDEYEKAVMSLDSKKKLHDVYFSYKYIKPKWEGLGGGGVKLLSLYLGKKVLLAVLDANGISSDCKDRLEFFAKKFFDEVLILTTDTHEVNVKRGVINELVCNEDEEMFYNALKDLSEKVEEKRKKGRKAAVYYGRKEFNARVVGIRNVVEITTQLINYLYLFLGFFVFFIVFVIFFFAFI